LSYFADKVDLRDVPHQFMELKMYKVEIHIGDGWGFDDEEKLVIETTDFEKAQIIQEFIEFQKDYGWAVEYDVVTEFDDEEDEYEDEDYDAELNEDESVEVEESEEYEIGETVEDEDGLVWERVA
jgi:hypothetical protein